MIDMVFAIRLLKWKSLKQNSPIPYSQNKEYDERSEWLNVCNRLYLLYGKGEGKHCRLLFIQRLWRTLLYAAVVRRQSTSTKRYRYAIA